MTDKVSTLDTVIANLAGEGLVRVDAGALPPGYCIAKRGDSFYGVTHDGWRSCPMENIEQATTWIEHRAYAGSGAAPRYGELWTYLDRVVIICGNTVDAEGTVWVMDWNSGERLDVPVDKLGVRPDRRSLTEAAFVERFTGWAGAGNQHAMWWLAWWFEGTNHPKSVWFYVAALRADPKGLGWAQDRITSDARHGGMCKGVPRPDTNFVQAIPELCGEGIGSDWKAALNEAASAVHVPAKDQDPGERLWANWNESGA